MLKRLAWFAGLWLVSVLTISAVAMFLRFLILRA